MKKQSVRRDTIRKWVRQGSVPQVVKIIDHSDDTAQLVIVFADGKRVDEQWGNKRILRAALAHWIGLAHTPLEVNGIPCGVVMRYNEELSTHGYFPSCMCHLAYRPGKYWTKGP